LFGYGIVADAEPIQFRITGTIDVQFQVGPLPPGVSEGAPFEAILSYDLATPDFSPDDPNRGYYSTSGVENNYLLIRAGMSEMRSVDPLTFWIGNDVDEPQEIFEFRNDTFSMFDVPFVGNFEHSSVTKLVFRWNDPTRLALMSDALPTNLDPTLFFDAFPLNFTPPQFVQPFIEVSTFQFDPRVFQFTFHAVVDSMSVIPEPTTLFCSLIAIVANVVRFRRVDARRVCRVTVVPSSHVFA
jgi:hypothetical protein